MRRTKIAVTMLATVGLALGVGLGARAMPMSAVQDWCTGAGGDWDGWVGFEDENDDGDFEPIEFGTCTWYTGSGGYGGYGDRYTQVYRDGERIRSCTHQGSQSTCGYDKPAPSPTPAPTPVPNSNPQVGSTSGTYQQPTATPTARPTTTSTSGTYAH
jgi:hypothetical protein